MESMETIYVTVSGTNHYHSDFIVGFSRSSKFSRFLKPVVSADHYEFRVPFPFNGREYQFIFNNSKDKVNICSGFVYVVGTKDPKSFEFFEKKLNERDEIPSFLLIWKESGNPMDLVNEKFLNERKINFFEFEDSTSKSELENILLSFAQDLITNKFSTNINSKDSDGPATMIKGFVILEDSEDSKPLDVALQIAYKHHGGLVSDIEYRIRKANDEEKKKNQINLTVEEYVAIYLYTDEFSPNSKSLYKLLNKDLTNSNRSYTSNWKYFLHYFFNGLRKLPNSGKMDLYRCVKENLVLRFPDRYKKGGIVTFYSCTSTSTRKQVAEERCDGTYTLFIFHNTEGRMLEGISRFPKENEVLLPPSSRFRILSVTNKPPSVFNKINVTKEVIIELEQIPPREKFF